MSDTALSKKCLIVGSLSQAIAKSLAYYFNDIYKVSLCKYLVKKLRFLDANTYCYLNI